MYILIDNYDSFVYNLAAYFQEHHCPIEVIRNETVNEADLTKRIKSGEIKGLILSPGPKRPEDSFLSALHIYRFQNCIPILGVCLGHQIIAHYYGGTVKKGSFPMHGKISTVYHNSSPLFQNIPSEFKVTRYHSLIVDETTLPQCLEIDAYAEDHTIMALHHKEYPVYGVQFHPEAVLTEYGHDLIQNFIGLCEEYRR